MEATDSGIKEASAVADVKGRGNRFVDLGGAQFGRLRVIRVSEKSSCGHIFWFCECRCGQSAHVRSRSLVNGGTKSCGCLQKESAAKHILKSGAKNVTHGESRRTGRTPEYECWHSIKWRCHNPRSTFFHYYGGRGISVCARWRASFEDFLADMGRKPSPKHSIDRFPDNNGNYEPGNCRWATAKEQAANRRSPVTCEFHADLGEKETQSEATVQGQMAVQESTDAPLPSPWTDEEFVEFQNQEPLPPNQGFQLPAEEQPIKESEEYAEH